MSKKGIITLILGAILVGGVAFKELNLSKRYKSPQTTYISLENIVSAVKNTIIPDQGEILIESVPKAVHTKRRYIPPTKLPLIALSSKNMITVRGTVSAQSMNLLKYKLLKMSKRLPKTSPIYLVLDTPGGSVSAGNSFISVARTIPQKVHTITIFAASMGFQIVQALGNRYITSEGTLMSHRAKIGGLGGEIPGELIVRLNRILKTLRKSDIRVAKRVGMTLKDYRELVRDEYWVDGGAAVKEQMADLEVAITCSNTLLNSIEAVKIDTFLGTVSLNYSRCPLLEYPVNLDYKIVKKLSKKQKLQLEAEIKLYVNDKSGYVRRRRSY